MCFESRSYKQKFAIDILNWTNYHNDARINKIESQECLHVVALVEGFT
jgi:hypothetical protein